MGAWEHANDGILITNARQADLPIVYASRSFEHLTGYRRDEIIGRNCRFLQGPDTAPEVVARIRAALKSGAGFKGEILNYRKSGEPFWNLLKITPLRDASGCITHFAGVQTDISEQKRIQHSLDERLRLNKLLAGISAAFLNAPAQGIDGEMEAALREIVIALGADRSALLEFSDGGTRLRHINVYSVPGVQPPPTIISEAMPWYTGQLRRGNTVVLARCPEDIPEQATAERTYVQKRGIKSHLAVPLTVGGSPVGAFGVTYVRSQRSWSPELIQSLRLVGEIFASALARRRVEEALVANERQLRAMADSLPVLIAYVDEQERYRFNNVAYEHFLGISRTEIHGRTVREVLGEAAYEAVRCPIGRALSGERVHFETEVPYRGMGPRQMEITYVPHVGACGKVLGFYTLIQDVSERKQMELEAQRQRDELAHVMRVAMMGELTAAIAHELGQPLTAILSNAQAARRLLAAEPPKVPQVQGALDDIIESDKRAAEVIRRLRAFLRKRDLEVSEFDIGPLVQDVIGLVHKEMLDKKVTARLELEAALPRVHGDRIQLEQVLLNLVLNALDAMSEDSIERRELVVHAGRTAPRTLSVSVADTGVGLQPAALNKLFTSFFTTKPHGLGMGLAISRSIIEAHGGRLQGQPAPTGGAIFRFDLPVDQEETHDDAEHRAHCG